MVAVGPFVNERVEKLHNLGVIACEATLTGLNL